MYLALLLESLGRRIFDSSCSAQNGCQLEALPSYDWPQSFAESLSGSYGGDLIGLAFFTVYYRLRW